MQKATTSMRIYAQNKYILDEQRRVMDAFAANTGSRPRATVKVAKRIIINAPFMLNGRMWDVKSKSLGAGVYELRLIRFEE